jgi:hypothetical protein
MSGHGPAGPAEEISPRFNWKSLLVAAGPLLADDEGSRKNPNFQGRTSPLGWATKWSQ